MQLSERENSEIQKWTGQQKLSILNCALFGYYMFLALSQKDLCDALQKKSWGRAVRCIQMSRARFDICQSFNYIDRDIFLGFICPILINANPNGLVEVT